MGNSDGGLQPGRQHNLTGAPTRCCRQGHPPDAGARTMIEPSGELDEKVPLLPFHQSNPRGSTAGCPVSVGIRSSNLQQKLHAESAQERDGEVIVDGKIDSFRHCGGHRPRYSDPQGELRHHHRCQQADDKTGQASFQRLSIAPR